VTPGRTTKGPLSFVGLAGVLDLKAFRLVVESEDEKD
jgi:hypothetical protein